ncbi:MAG: hypothetical protein EA426_15640 [Spirochaetaceae bacterium]|nr:MAG: hypothetical protein EA426_15640 [Spirochaetaceae bacterium]
MSKAHRGAGAREEYPRSGRGTCPITKKTGVKLLYEHEIDGKKVMISKTAKATIANAKRREARKQKKTET